MTNTEKVAIVVGASRGLGRAIAEDLAGRGYRVVVDYRGDAAFVSGANVTVTGGLLL